MAEMMPERVGRQRRVLEHVVWGLGSWLKLDPPSGLFAHLSQRISFSLSLAFSSPSASLPLPHSLPTPSLPLPHSFLFV